MKFTQATKRRAKLRLAISGLAGGGKTWTSLAIAQHLVENGRVAVIDTERGSASLYANKFQFDVLELEKHGPLDYTQALDLAASSGYDVVVIDSLSHAWIDALERVDQAVDRGSGNSFTAWRKVSPAHNKLVDAILSSPMHVIATMRSKVEYALEDNDRGKKVPKKVGLAPVQRSGVDYEFTIVGDIDLEHRMLISKSRADVIPVGETIERPGEAFARRLRNWLNDGAPVVAAPREEVRQFVADMAASDKPDALGKMIDAGRKALDRIPDEPVANDAPKVEPTVEPLAEAMEDAFKKYLRAMVSTTSVAELDRVAGGPGKPTKGTPEHEKATDIYKIHRRKLLAKQPKQQAGAA